MQNTESSFEEMVRQADEAVTTFNPEQVKKAH